MPTKVNSILAFCIYIFLIATVFAQADMNKSSVVELPPQTVLVSPYLIEISVSGYGDIEREQNFIRALKLVLMRISNDPNIINLPEVKTALSNPGLYVKQFKYINKNSDTGLHLFLQIGFDDKAIEMLLHRSSKIVLFDNGKPLALVWLAKEVGTGKILADEQDDYLLNILRKKARELDMPIILPLLDLKDVSGIKAQDICYFNKEKIRMVSSRYGTSLIIIGCIRSAVLGNVWSSQWLLLKDNHDERFSFIDKSAEGVIAQALRAINDKISNVVTHTTEPYATKVVLRITNVSGLEQYNEIVRYLHAFSKVITSIDLINIGSTEVVMTINIIGGQQVLLDIFNKQNRLMPNHDVVISPPGIDLDYKWVTLDHEKTQTINTQPLS